MTPNQYDKTTIRFPSLPFFEVREKQEDKRRGEQGKENVGVTEEQKQRVVGIDL